MAQGTAVLSSAAEYAVTFSIARLFALCAMPLLAACAAPPTKSAAPPPAVPGYEGVQDGEFFIPPVQAKYLHENTIRTEVAYTADDAPGTIVVDTHSRKLYYVLDGGRAIRYGIAVGREGLTFRGNGVIGRKSEWPSWQPTANMIRTRPDLYAEYAGGLPGGLENPLGARALYLYRGGRDTMFRVHGTIDNASIGHATSAGCIRLFNQDALDLYSRVDTGARIKVRSEAESLATDGPMMDDAYGRVVPATSENVAQKTKDEATIAKKAAADAVLARKVEKKRLSACKRRGIPADDCPIPVPEDEAA